MEPVINEITKKIKKYFDCQEHNPIIYSNELHLQMHLAQFLVSEGYVILYEYHVPAACFSNIDEEIYPWRTKKNHPQKMYLDLVVKINNEYIPIEIKYKTRALKKDTQIFDVEERGVELLRNQGAQDWGMYGFWKDVHRLELVCNIFNTVKNGIALFVTNDPLYYNPQKHDNKKVNYYNFRMEEGRIVNGPMKWMDSDSDSAIRLPAFNLLGSYKVTWYRIGLHSDQSSSENFRYCFVKVKKAQGK